MKLKQIKGCLTLELVGTLPESVLNACAMNAIELWNMQCADAYTLRFCAREQDLEQIRAIAQKCMCELEVIDKGQIIKQRDRLKRRWHLPVFLAVITVLLLISGLFVWDIQLEGCESLSRGQVLRALEDCGLKEGCFWPAISSDMLRSHMIEKLPEIAWMSVNVSGSRAHVQIKERQQKPEIYNEEDPTNIIAAKTGIIRRMSVLNGYPLVSAGDTVMQGDVLVSGSPESLLGTFRQLRARAQVYADTWYEISSAAPMLPQKNAHGPGYGRLALKFGKNRINFYISSGKGVDECDKIIRECKIGIEGLFTLPVTIVWESFKPYKAGDYAAPSEEQMEISLRQTLQQSIEGEIEYSTVTASLQDGLYMMTLRAQCLENIACEEEFTRQEETWPESRAGEG